MSLAFLRRTSKTETLNVQQGWQQDNNDLEKRTYEDHMEPEQSQ